MKGKDMANPQVTGAWTRVDDSKFHLEIAPTELTEQEGMFAIRSPQDPSAVLYTTERQIRNAEGRMLDTILGWQQRR